MASETSATAPASHYGQSDLGLNPDLLILLYDFLPERHDVLRLMQTCHFMHSAGISCLLSHPVALGPDSYSAQSDSNCTQAMHKAVTFTDFVCSDLQHRAGQLQRIEITSPYDWITDETFGKLLEILRHSTRLETFRIEDCKFSTGRVVIDARSRSYVAAILEALVMNEQLKTLELSQTSHTGMIDTELVIALQKWRAPLKEVYLEGPTRSDSEAGHGQVHPYWSDPTWVLQAFSATLQELRIDNLERLQLESGLVFPSMKTLIFVGLATPLKHVWAIARAFPNLRRLILWLTNGLRMTDRLRLDNYAENLGCCWPSLESVEGSVEEVYALGLPCRIRSLGLYISDGVDDMEIQASRRMLSTILRVAGPSDASFVVGFSPRSWESEAVETLLAAVDGEHEYPSQQEVAISDLRTLNPKARNIIDAYVDILSGIGPLDYLSLDISHSLTWSFNARQDGDARPICMPCDTKSSSMISPVTISLAVHIAGRISTLSKLKLSLQTQSSYICEILTDEGGQKTLHCISSDNIPDVPVPV